MHNKGWHNLQYHMVFNIILVYIMLTLPCVLNTVPASKSPAADQGAELSHAGRTVQGSLLYHTVYTTTG